LPYILGFHGLARYGLSFHIGGIAFLEGDNGPYDGCGFRFHRADYVLGGKQNFGAYGLAFGCRVGVYHLHGLFAVHREHTVDCSAVAATGKCLGGDCQKNCQKKQLFHFWASISWIIS
jgi:hypothetical protein